ncbi:hypothetical protein C8R48DRAFT_673998 [Suillus tomentosus]|nr:hypothetical protein C8R48DRAFT_673998 [Suillus tomentosus]
MIFKTLSMWSDLMKSLVPKSLRVVMIYTLVGMSLEIVKNMLKGQIQRAWLQLMHCAPYPRILVDIQEQVVRLIQMMSELDKKQQRTTRDRGGGDKSIRVNPETSGGRQEEKLKSDGGGNEQSLR